MTTFEFLWIPWSLGALMFVLFFVLLTVRLVLVGMLGSAGRPTMLLPLANLAMSTVSYIQLNSLTGATPTSAAGPYDNFARVMFFVAVREPSTRYHAHAAAGRGMTFLVSFCCLTRMVWLLSLIHI